MSSIKISINPKVGYVAIGFSLRQSVFSRRFKFPRSLTFKESAILLTLCKHKVAPMEFLFQIQEKVTSAMLTVPTTKDWIVAAVLLLIVAATCLPLGLWCRFLDVRTPKLSAIKTIRILVDRLLLPCFAEELIFRVLLLPVKNNLISIKVKLLLGAVSLTAYVASHPINATLFYKQASETFINPFFLFSTTVLGIACTFAYTISGSIWTPIAIHWITVIGWGSIPLMPLLTRADKTRTESR